MLSLLKKIFGRENKSKENKTRIIFRNVDERYSPYPFRREMYQRINEYTKLTRYN
ncbi:MAG: hypothetical protein WC584_02845 [Candidatus Pacearchaeota archaeon]